MDGKRKPRFLRRKDGVGTHTLELKISASKVATSVAGVTVETTAGAVAVAKVVGDAARPRVHLS